MSYLFLTKQITNSNSQVNIYNYVIFDGEVSISNLHLLSNEKPAGGEERPTTTCQAP